MQEIGMWMFDNELSDIYFDGTEAEWNNISINKDNVNVYNANIHFDNGYFSGGVGSKEDPYQVSSIKELNAIRYDMTPNTHYIQTADIDLIDVEWEPIGRSPSWNNEGIVKFWGVFDGNSYTISNMTITSISSENESLGLFGVNAGVLRNIQLSEITIDVDIHNECCYADIGGIAGINEGTITNCTVDGMIRSSCDIFIQNEAEYLGWTPIQRVGGIVGIGNCSNCKNYADISASGQYEIEYMNNHEACEVICGGVVGFPGTVNSEIRNCINYGSVHSSADGFAIAGGISGKDGSINYCVNYGNISSNSLALEMYTYYCQSNAGGIVGVTSADLSSHCVNFGDVSATKTCEDSGCSAGGIAGQIGYYYAGDISDCYNFADSIHADITCPEDPNDAVLVESTTYVGSIYGDWYWWDGELRAENSYSIDSTRLSDTNVDCVVGYNGEQLSDKEINLAIKDIMLALELPWQDISGNMEDGLILFSDYTNMCISVGSNITLSAGIIRNGERQKDVSGITFQVGDTSVLQVVVAGETDNTRFVELKGLAEGTTTVIFNDSITGYIATTVVTVCDNNSHAYALNNIPVQHIEKYPTNFYNVNGLYIDSYSYEINTDKSATVTFDVYNTNYTYGVVEVCDEDGNVTDAVLIEKMSSPNSDLKRALWDNIGFIIRDIRDKDLLTYRQESGFTKMTPVTVRIPEGGYIKISTSPFDSTIVALVNGADFLMSMAELGGDIDGFIENSFNYAKGLTMELIEAKAYADIVKDGSKIPEKLVKNVGKEVFVTSESLGHFSDTIAANIDETNLWSAIGKTASSFGWSTGEKAFTYFAGPAGVALQAMFLIGKAENVVIQAADYTQAVHSPWAIRIFNQGGGIRGSQQIKVETETDFPDDIVLNVYKAKVDSVVLETLKQDNPVLYKEITKGITHTYDISLVRNREEIQLDRVINVYIPIPDDLKLLAYDGKVKIYRTEADGTMTEMDTRIESNCFAFSTNHFSLYTIVGYDPGAEEEHIYGDWEITKAVTATSEGEEQRSCVCGEIQTRRLIPVTLSASAEPVKVTAGAKPEDVKIGLSASLSIGGALVTDMELDYIITDESGKIFTLEEALAKPGKYTITPKVKTP